MKTLLSLINEPVNSGGLIRYSVEMAADTGLNLHFLYIQNPAIYTLSTGTAVAAAHTEYNELDEARLEADRKEALQEIEKNIEDIRYGISSDIDIKVSSETGAMDLVVNQLVSENKADLLLLEGQEERGFWILNSADTELLLRINCPGLLIPPGIKYEMYRKIVYATDYNQKDVQVMKDIVAITGKLEPDITILHVTDSDEKHDKIMKPEFRQDLTNQTGYDKISAESIKDDKSRNPGDSIIDYARSINANLVVVMKENKKFLERMFKQSVTEKVLKKTSLPVLVYHENEQA